MAVEERLRSKYLYKIQLYLLKVIPIVMAFFCLLNTVLSYFDIDVELLSYIGSCSVLTVIFLYISSYVFKFCEYHRMFLYYITVTQSLSAYDTYVGVPLSDRGILSVYLAISGIFLFIILRLYVKYHKKPTQ